jgi:TPR repeat protein
LHACAGRCKESGGKACSDLFGLLEEDTSQYDPPVLAGVLQRACSSNAPWACGRAAELLQSPTEQRTALLLACDLGDADSCATAGRAALNASKTPTDIRELNEVSGLLTRGCAGGSPASCHGLGFVFQILGRAPEDARQAFSQACDAMLPGACLEAARSCLESGGHCDVQEAFAKACNMGSPEACQEGIRLLWRKADGTDPSSVSAQAIKLRSACDAGTAFYCNALGLILQKAEGNDSEASKSLYSKSCDYGNSKGCILLGIWLDRKERGAPLGRGRELFDRACRMGDQWGCYIIGSRLLEALESTAQSKREGLAMVRAACDFGVASACTASGRAAMNGLAGQPPSRRAALRAYRQACTRRHGAGCYEAAALVEQLVGTRSAEARRLYERACHLKHERACSLTSQGR